MTFRVDQVPNLSPGTMIYNDADIYFDFNAPIITNETFLEIEEDQFLEDVNDLSEITTSLSLKLFPNPTAGKAWVQFPTELIGETLTLYDLNGRVLLTQDVTKNWMNIDLSAYRSGVYLIRCGATKPIRIIRK